MNPLVENPEHYKNFPLEVIEIIHFVLGDEGFKAYCIGNELKYRLRAGFKTAEYSSDMEKALVYRKFLKRLEGENA